MKAFTVVSLVCYLVAASAGLTLPAITFEKTPTECRRQAYLETLNCARFGLQNGTAELECLSAVVLKYMKCVEDSEPQLNEEPLPLGANSTDIKKPTINKFKCIFNIMLDSTKCIVNDETSHKPKINWAGVIKCLVTNIPALLMCFPQNP